MRYLLLALGISIFTQIADAQHSSSAVMEVKAEVISGSSFVRTDREAPMKIGSVENEKKYGEFSLFLPDDVHVVVSGLESVEMEYQSVSWRMNSKMEQEVSDPGNFIFRFSTTATNQNLKEHLYKGVQVATIEYL